MAQKPPEFLALERAIAPFAEGFDVRSGDDGVLSGVYLHRNFDDGAEVGVFAGMLLDEDAYPHFRRCEAPEGLVMAYVDPSGTKARIDIVDAAEGILRRAHAQLMPIASPEPFELFEDHPGALVRRRRLPEDVESLMDRRLLEFCRGSLALLGQVSVLDTLRDYDPNAEPEEDPDE